MLIASAVIFVAVRQDVVGRVDSALTHHAALLVKRYSKRQSLDVIKPPRRASAGLSSTPAFAQVANADGSVAAREQVGLVLPVPPGVRSVAAGRAGPYFSNVAVGGIPIRMYVTTFGRGQALQVFRPVTELDAELGRLAAVLIATGAGGILMALLLGMLVAGLALRPVRLLTEAAERVTSTRDFSNELPKGGNDELARLATSINTMLDAVNTSQSAQRQLVADASHELRTPLTSLRTNVEVLAESRDLDPPVRQQLVADLTLQFDSLNTLLSDLVALARQDDPGAATSTPETLYVDAIVDGALSHARRNYPHVRFNGDLTPACAKAVPADLERLVGNLLDNAAKWSPYEGTVEVRVETRSEIGDHNSEVVISVRDHGPGIDAEDLPHVFDRFYRGQESGRVPGSGLGLAIARRVAEAQGGSIVAERARGGGTRMTVRLPALDVGPSTCAPGGDG
ncbi:MAG: HAMP domain-containing sensor histidine kinase [Acidimicrobiales bacterium]